MLEGQRVMAEHRATPDRLIDVYDRLLELYTLRVEDTHRGRGATLKAVERKNVEREIDDLLSTVAEMRAGKYISDH